MPLPSPTSVSDRVYTTTLANLTAATVQFMPIINPGRVKRLAVTPTVVTATGSGTVQLAYAPPGSSTFTNIVSGIVTVPSATAAGVTTQADMTPSADAFVQDGGTLRMTVGGTATGGGVPAVAVSIGV